MVMPMHMLAVAVPPMVILSPLIDVDPDSRTVVHALRAYHSRGAPVTLHVTIAVAVMTGLQDHRFSAGGKG